MNVGDKQDLVAAPLKSRLCIEPDPEKDYHLSFNESRIECNACHSGIAQMESDIAAVSSIKKSVLARLSEITRPEAKVERVRISAYMGSSITSKTELDKGIKKLREHLEKLLEEGKTVILE